MKVLKILKKSAPLLGVVLVFMASMFVFSIFVEHTKQNENKKLFNIRYYVYNFLNSSSFGTWETQVDSAHSFFKNRFGYALFEIIGNSKKFTQSTFSEGVDSAKFYLYEKKKMLSSTIEIKVENGTISEKGDALTFADQLIEIKFAKSSSVSFIKNCFLTTHIQMTPKNKYDGFNLKVDLKSSNCPEISCSIESNVSATFIKTLQIIFHVIICYFVIGLLTYFLVRLETSLSQQPQLSNQISIVFLLIIGTFQLFNGFEQLILSVFGFPLWGFIIMIGVAFINLFFFIVLKILTTIIKNQIDLAIQQNEFFNLRAHLLFTYLLGHSTIMLTFYFCMSQSDNPKFYLLLSFSILPQIIKNFFAKTRFLVSSKDISGLYWFTIIYVVFQHFYTQNFFYVKNSEGFEAKTGVKIVLQSACFYMFVVIQETINPQRFFYNNKSSQDYNYFLTYDDLKNEGESDMNGLECIICLSKIEKDFESADWKPVVENEELQDYILENLQKPLMKCPCKHVYHSGCLLEWMNVKMECPTCRKKLPPLT